MEGADSLGRRSARTAMWEVLSALTRMLAPILSFTETYEQIPLGQDQVEDAIKYLRENDMATIKFFKGSAFLVEAPNFVNLTVTETEPGVRGDTATNVTKAATVETGAVVQVPIFINEGEKIQIDTRSGEYLGRAKE